MFAAPKGVLGAPCLAGGNCIEANSKCGSNDLCECREDFYENSGFCCEFLVSIFFIFFFILSRNPLCTYWRQLQKKILVTYFDILKF